MKKETKKKLKKALLAGAAIGTTAVISMVVYKKVPAAKKAVNFIVSKVTKKPSSIVKNTTEVFARPAKKGYRVNFKK